MSEKTPYAQNAPNYNNNHVQQTHITAQKQADCKSSWLERNYKHKPQQNSVGAATFIFMSGGLNIAWSFDLNSYTSVLMTAHMRSAWFIGGIIGALLGALLNNNVRKKPLMLAAAILVVLSGVLFIALPHNFSAVLASRYFNGIANGFAFVPTLVMIGEELVPPFRGMVAGSVESMGFSLGIYLQFIYNSAFNAESSANFNASQLLGVISTFYGVLSILIGAFLIVETPIFWLVRGQEQRAVDSLRRLERPHIVTNETYQQLEEHKRYIAENKQLTFAQSAKRGLPALFKLCFYRLLSAMGLSLFVCYAFVESSSAYFYWPLIVFGILRWLGTFITVFMLDKKGRKLPTLYGMLIAGCLALSIAFIFGLCTAHNTEFTVAMYLLLVFQLFAGMAISASSAYLTEAFPLAIKPYFIAIAFAFEMLTQIVICNCTMSVSGVTAYFGILSALAILFFIFGISCLPETARTTLREAQAKFRGFIPMHGDQ